MVFHSFQFESGGEDAEKFLRESAPRMIVEAMDQAVTERNRARTHPEPRGMTHFFIRAIRVIRGSFFGPRITQMERIPKHGRRDSRV